MTDVSKDAAPTSDPVPPSSSQAQPSSSPAQPASNPAQPASNPAQPERRGADVADGGRRRSGGATAERSNGSKLKAGSDAVRNKIASLVWLVAVICALFLAVGALLIALNANRDNQIVAFVLDGARLLQGPFEDLFQFKGENAATKAALVNWGIAAVVYLIIGKILDRIIRP